MKYDKHMYIVDKQCLNYIVHCLTILINSAVVTFGNLQSMLHEEKRTVPKKKDKEYIVQRKWHGSSNFMREF